VTDLSKKSAKKQIKRHYKVAWFTKARLMQNARPAAKVLTMPLLRQSREK
jgi:hypothetical protein